MHAGCSILPVSNAFIIVVLIMAVYAIMGVQLFGEVQKEVRLFPS
jgi:hypothetical protein